MSEEPKPSPGQIVWHDLTIPNAEEVRDFYARVVGWTHQALSMGEYDDYLMNMPDSGETAAGVCHTRGPNAKIPPQWLVYFAVANVDESIRSCQAMGGEVVDGPRKMGDQFFCVVRDPAGAVCALIGPGSGG